MPYLSEAQRKKFQTLYKQGKISKKTLEEYNKASEGLKLPKRVKKKKTTKKKANKK